MGQPLDHPVNSCWFSDGNVRKARWSYLLSTVDPIIKLSSLLMALLIPPMGTPPGLENYIIYTAPILGFSSQISWVNKIFSIYDYNDMVSTNSGTGHNLKVFILPHLRYLCPIENWICECGLRESLSLLHNKGWGDRSVVERWARNSESLGSNPAHGGLGL